MSKGTEPALGIPNPGPIDKYINNVNTNANILPTFPAKLLNPPNLPTTITPKTGKTTAVINNPINAHTALLPDCCPNNGGNIKLPAPKNNENKVKLNSNIFLLFSFIYPPNNTAYR